MGASFCSPLIPEDTLAHLRESRVVEFSVQAHSCSEYSQNVLARRTVGHAEADFTLKASGAPQRRIEGVGTIGRANHDDSAR